MTTQATATSTKETKARTTMTISPTGLKGLDMLAGMFNISRSELCDRIGRGQIQILIPSAPLLTQGLPDKAAGEAA
ncbi:MAG: hypothetical protein AAF959_01060 [Cyanobacteria bacterium P01_D01_bin.56]